MPTISIADETNARMAAIAKPLEDTHDSVIAKLLDYWEAGSGGPVASNLKGQSIQNLEDGRMIFAAANPPDLNFTTCQQIVIDGEQLPKNQTYWNNLVHFLVRKLHIKGMQRSDIRAMLTHANSVDGEKTDSGYRYLEDVGISIQGQDSNGAFRQAYFLISLSAFKGDIFFEWQNNSKAAFPNKRGYFSF